MGDIQELLDMGSELINSEEIAMPRKKKRISILDSLQDKVKIPESLQNQYITDIANNVEKQKVLEQTIENSKIKDKPVTIEENQLVKQQLIEKTGMDLPEENINIIKIVEEIDTALENIPDGATVNFEDIKIVASKTEKDSDGYFKTKTSLSAPDVINKIATSVKGFTKGTVVPRICDLRVISNTNRVQLRGNKIKLCSVTCVFKPKKDSTLKVNKGTRIMVSVPKDYNETKNLIVYLQESRKKTILEIVAKDFSSMEEMNKFIVARIIDFYNFGYDITLKKLLFKSMNNPLMDLTVMILKTGEFKAHTYNDEDGHVYSVDFVAKDTENHWLKINVDESKTQGLYDILALNNINDDWNYNLISRPAPLKWLYENLYILLSKHFEKDWSNELNVESDSKVLYFYDKLTHNKLKKSLLRINDISEEFNENEILIQKTLNKTDTKKLLNNDYDSEAIIGKTAFLDYFILTFLAFPIVGGDARKGREYITTDEYYDKYNVSDRNDYEKRSRTILTKELNQRNYNSRIYLFQLEYSTKNKKHIYRDKDFESLLNDTGFLTSEILFPVTKY